MKVFRWRLWVLMGLVLVCALGLKAVLMVRARQAAIERRARLMDPFTPPRTPEEQAELVGFLGDPDAEIRLTAVRKLAQVGSTAPELVGPLIELLEAETAEDAHENRWSPRPDSAKALQRFQFPLPVIAPRLGRALANPDRHVRSQALAVLADAAARPGPGAAPESAVAPPLAILGDDLPWNRSRAAEILTHLGPAARGRAVAVLLEQLRGPDRPMRLLAADDLARFDPEGGAGAAILADRLAAGDLRSHVEDLYLLGRLGPLARPAVPAIVRAMAAPGAWEDVPFWDGFFPPGCYWNITGIYTREVNSRSGPLGAAVLGRIGPDAEREAVALLIGMVRDGDGERQQAAARALGDLGTRAATAFPDLLALVERTTDEIPERRGSWFVNVAAELTETLRLVVPGDDPRLVAALVRLLEAGTPMQRYDAEQVLSQLEPPAPAAVPALIRALKEEPQRMRHLAALALGRYAGPERDAAIPALLAALRDEDGYVRFQAGESLSRLGAGAEAVVPATIGWLTSTELYYRSEAVAILGRYGPAAAPALPALHALQSDPDVFVREAVAKAIPLIDAPVPAP